MLNIITGGFGSGKSAHLCDLIRETLSANLQSKAILIVPEQFSYSAEKYLSEEMGGLGLNRVDVVTLSRLARKFVDTSSDLLPSGKMMLVCKAAASVSEENIFYPSINKPGFLSSLAELFSEFRRYCIAPEDLEGLSLSSPAAEKKIASINEIYSGYLSLFGEDFTDSDDTPRLFAEKIIQSKAFSDTYIFIDDYNDFLPQHYDVLRAFITTAPAVHVTLSIGSEDEGGIFAPVIKTKKTLQAIALGSGVQLCGVHLEGGYDYIASPDLRFLIENWESQKSFTESCENVEIFTARSLYSETERTAAEIIAAVRDRGLRFRDIGVVCGDINQYLHILNAVFADYRIPFFSDEKLTVTQHPVAKTVLSLFNIIEENWSYSAVFDYLRSGCVYTKTKNGAVPLEPEDIDVLENYVLLYGIKGKKMWFEQWTKAGETIFDDVIENRSVSEYDLEKLNRLRLEIITPFNHFLENKGRTAAAICSAVYDFMCDINLYEGLLMECDTFDSLGKRDESEQYKQVWNTVLEVLDQLVIAAGKGSISRSTFADFFKNGLSQCQLSIIPSGLDRVTVSSAQKNSPQKVKELYILGAVYGAIPAIGGGDSILTDHDRTMLLSALSQCDKELAPDNMNKALRENLRLYRICASASDRLSISFPAANSEGGAMSPAGFISDISKILPKATRRNNVLSKPSNEELLASSKRGFYYMLERLSEYYNEKPEALWQSVFNWYSKNPQYAGKLEILKNAAKYKKLQPRLSQLKAQLLYGKNKKYSITALEKYSKCPFSYYVERGLYARPQEVKRVEKSHIGSLIHAAVCSFCRLVEDGARSISDIHARWVALTAEDCDLLIAQVMEDMSEKILARTGSDKKQIEYLLSRCQRTLKKSVDSIRKSLAKGEYTSICYEKDFEVSIDWQGESITLLGTIDRIDIMEQAAENKVNIRIVDYKSGHKKFSIAAICNKIDMQLVLYSIAAVKMYEGGALMTDSGKKPQISALLYNRLNDDYVSIPENDPALAEKELAKQRKMDGIVILDEDAETGGLIADTVYGMDSDFEETHQSEFLNLSLKKDNTFTASSQVASRGEFDIMSDYIRKAVIDMDKEIKSGRISISPYRDGVSSSCNYCQFKEACMFDSAFDKCRPLISGTDKAMEKMKKEVRPDE